METTTITIKVPQELRTAFKMVALRQKKTMTDILLKAIKKTIKDDKSADV